MITPREGPILLQALPRLSWKLMMSTTTNQSFRRYRYMRLGSLHWVVHVSDCCYCKWHSRWVIQEVIHFFLSSWCLDLLHLSHLSPEPYVLCSSPVTEHSFPEPHLVSGILEDRVEWIPFRASVWHVRRDGLGVSIQWTRGKTFQNTYLNLMGFWSICVWNWCKNRKKMMS